MDPAAEAAAGRMAAAAAELLDTLDADQRRAAAWPFPSDEERLRWYYTPTDHGGLPLQAMRPHQQQLAFRLLASGLSRPAYAAAATIVGLENVLDELEGWSLHWGRERGRDPGLYYVRVFGEPGGDAWSWRFGGHHVSVHHLVIGGRVAASTPLFLGADPAASPLPGGAELRPLGATEDLGRELLATLDREQRSRAVLARVAPYDLVGGNRPRTGPGDTPLRLPEIWRGRFDGELGELVEVLQQRLENGLGFRSEHLEALRLPESPAGLAASDMTAGQRDLLRHVLAGYLERLPEDLASAALAPYDAGGLDAVHFTWAGGFERGVPHYYRLHGPRLLIEYENAQRAGNHAHSVLRDPEGDFGVEVLGQHLLREARSR